MSAPKANEHTDVKRAREMVQGPKNLIAIVLRAKAEEAERACATKCAKCTVSYGAYKARAAELSRLADEVESA